MQQVCTRVYKLCTMVSKLCTTGALYLHKVVHHTCARSSFPKCFQSCPCNLSNIGHYLVSCVHTQCSFQVVHHHFSCCALGSEIFWIICTHEIACSIFTRDTATCTCIYVQLSFHCTLESHSFSALMLM